MIRNITPNLMVKSVEDSIEFYENILGFSVVTSVLGNNDNLQFAIVTKDNFTIMFQERKNFIEEYPLMNRLEVNPSISLFIEIEQFDDVYKKIKNEYPIYKELHTTFYGSKEFAIIDNNGYILTLSEYINKKE